MFTERIRRGLPLGSNRAAPSLASTAPSSTSDSGRYALAFVDGRLESRRLVNTKAISQPQAGHAAPFSAGLASLLRTKGQRAR